ncbi:MAG: polysaccharide deacetylase family protein [Candidatus Promineifilaceae bacterium]
MSRNSSLQPSTNPALKRLGLGRRDRAVIFHADDIGMAHCSLQAYADLRERGLAPAASVMAPCPWFAAAAAYCRQQARPGAAGSIDMGVHLTLTSEWDGCRWGPISTREPASGLLDAGGYFYRLAADVQRSGRPEAVQTELVAQIERALAAGIDVSHLDSHMLSLFHPAFLGLYFDLALHYRLPAFMLRAGAAGLAALGLDGEAQAAVGPALQAAEADGLPLFDHFHVNPLLEATPDRLAYARRVLADLPAGLTYFIIHPATDTPELRAMAADWPARVADYQLFMSDGWREAVRASGVEVLDCRALRPLVAA